MDEPLTNDFSLFRIYEPWECGKDGYPIAWHDVNKAFRERFDRGLIAVNFDAFDGKGLKDVVREEAGHRCIRCGHPYRVGESGVWSDPPDERFPASPTLVDQLEDFDVDKLEATASVMKGKLWSPCDDQCTHGGPVRWWDDDFGDWHEVDDPPERRGYFRVQQASWRILTVHHLNERKFDCRWHNLCALCQRCHLTIQRKVEMNQVWPTEHSEWFKPYAAGFYAYSYLGEELTRDETMARLDELLALERIA